MFKSILHGLLKVIIWVLVGTENYKTWYGNHILLPLIFDSNSPHWKRWWFNFHQWLSEKD